MQRKALKKNPTFLHDKSPGETRDTGICLHVIVNLIKKISSRCILYVEHIFPSSPPLCPFLSLLSSFYFCFSRVSLYKHPWFYIAICSWISTNEGKTCLSHNHSRGLLPVIPIFLKLHIIGYRLTFYLFLGFRDLYEFYYLATVENAVIDIDIQVISDTW